MGHEHYVILTMLFSLVFLVLVLKKEFIGPGLHLRPVHADRARPPFQWTLNSVFSAYENNYRRKDKTPSRPGNLEDRIWVTHRLRVNIH